MAAIEQFGAASNYSESFGFQWNRFATTQLHSQSSERFWRETRWTPAELEGADILEVGSGAGRFSRVILEETRANLYTVDYSSAVEANRRNNSTIAPDRFHLVQASIYDLPFPDGRFDKVLCLGVLQHTPDFEKSVEALVTKTRPGGEIIVDFYEIRGWWTKIHAKYLLRPLTRRMDHNRLLRLIERNVDWLTAAYDALTRAGLHSLTRFLPIVDIESVVPKDLTPSHRREWVILDTFDMFSPAFDQPQRTQDVIRMFERAGARVTSSEPGIVRATRKVGLRRSPP